MEKSVVALWQGDRRATAGGGAVGRVDEAVSKQELLDEVWEESDLDPNAVEVCIMQLRRKIGAEWIQTVRSVGYRLVEQFH